MEARLGEAKQIRIRVPGAKDSPALRSIPAQQAIIVRIRREMTVWEDLVKILATVYAEHPDYNEAWRPR